MEYIYIGDVVNTHGLKGEIRILSDFKFKDSVFKIGMNFYIGKNKALEQVTSYRVHKNYDMVTFKDKTYIDDVLIYKGEPVYVNRADLVYEGYLDEDLIGLDAYDDDKLMGKVVDIMKTTAHDILVIKNGKKHMVPNISEFVKKVDLENNCIYINYIKGLSGED